MKFFNMLHEENSSAPMRCRSYAYDANQQAESLVRWEQHYEQHSRGTFSGYLDELNLGGIHLFEEFTSQALLQHCCVGEDSLWIGFSQQCQSPRINANQLLPGQLMVRPSHVEFELVTPSDFHIFGLVLNKQTIADELTGLDTELWLGHPEDILVTNACPQLSYELAKLIRLLLTEDSLLFSPVASLGHQSRLKHIRPLIVSAITDLLAQITGPDLQTLKETRSARMVVIKRIQKHMAQTGEYPLTVNELCRIACVSRRTLQYAFEYGLDISPLVYVRNCRLNQIRRALLSTNSELCISDLAIGHGFYHIGLFNQYYKQLFGETPTQTRQRSVVYSQRVIAHTSAMA
ncbi:AraC family transcriptional regulator [Vibrio sp. HA2012]|uniref:helix-turn-helix domain-containing protein n=1 Tax=Vibrio sp. HA2012 TaxID=1971595 RepID=UPI000C2B81F3|nr:helix-turn-helix domain-containing protein [Vibrio sp. HA2012]PJC86872.1 AraC family transcriptional regulator [Vibrio sp. HA2012]